MHKPELQRKDEEKASDFCKVNHASNIWNLEFS